MRSYFGWRRRAGIIMVVEEKSCGSLLMAKLSIGVCRCPFWEIGETVGMYSIKFIYILKPLWKQSVWIVLKMLRQYMYLALCG